MHQMHVHKFQMTGRAQLRPGDAACWRCPHKQHKKVHRARSGLAASRNVTKPAAPDPSTHLPSPPQPKSHTFLDANFPMDPEGRTYHLGTKRGEVANRILSVGSVQRAELLAQQLEPPPHGQIFRQTSSRGFLTCTGLFRGTPVSIVSTHMGLPNMDFVVRECRAVVEGQMAIVRLGTCGAVQPPARLGDLLIASMGSISIRRDPDAFSDIDDNNVSSASGGSIDYGTSLDQSTHSNGVSSLNHMLRSSPDQAAVAAVATAAAEAVTAAPSVSAFREPYTICRPVLADAELCRLLVEAAASLVGRERVIQGLNASADSFYSSQGRIGTQFDDRNSGLLERLCARYPQLISLEMETFQLLDLARCSKGSVKAAGFCIALAERYTNSFLSYHELNKMEVAGGTAALTALTQMQLQGDISTAQHSSNGSFACVWAP